MDASCARYGSSLDSRLSACATSGAYFSSHPTYSPPSDFFSDLFLVGMSAIRMERVHWIAMRLRVGWRGSMRNCGDRNCLVVRVVVVRAGTPRVLRGQYSQSLPVRSSAEFAWARGRFRFTLNTPRTLLLPTC